MKSGQVLITYSLGTAYDMTDLHYYTHPPSDQYMIFTAYMYDVSISCLKSINDSCFSKIDRNESRKTEHFESMVRYVKHSCQDVTNAAFKAFTMSNTIKNKNNHCSIRPIDLINLDT